MTLKLAFYYRDWDGYREVLYNCKVIWQESRVPYGRILSLHKFLLQLIEKEKRGKILKFDILQFNIIFINGLFLEAEVSFQDFLISLDT